MVGSVTGRRAGAEAEAETESEAEAESEAETETESESEAETRGSHGVKVKRIGDGLRVTFYHFELWNFLGAMGGSLLFAVLWARERSDGAWDSLYEFLFLGMAVVLALGVVATLFNRTVLRLADGLVTWRTLGLAAPWARALELSRVERFEVDLRSETRSETREMGPDRRYTDVTWQVVAIVRGGSDPVVLVSGLTFREEKEARALAAALQGYLNS
jgi:hypothetical protein